MPNQPTEWTEVRLVNQALVRLGEEVITSLDDSNKRAQVMSHTYEFSRDLLLSKHDWSFAREYTKLELLADEAPTYDYVYQIPTDCMFPLDIFPRNRYYKWLVFASKRLETNVPNACLLYVKYISTVSDFTMSFMSAVVAHMTYIGAPGLTRNRDGKFIEMLRLEFASAWLEAIQEDSERGDEYRMSNEDPELDTFVHPEAGYIDMSSMYDYRKNFSWPHYFYATPGSPTYG